MDGAKHHGGFELGLTLPGEQDPEVVHPHLDFADLHAAHHREPAVRRVTQPGMLVKAAR